MGMKRRAFFSAFGIGTAATVASVAQGKAPQLDTPKRDIGWAREMTANGHRVRLASWITPIDQRPASSTKGASLVTFRQGTREGVESLDELALTGEMLEGPWEIVPESDWPKPPPPPPPPDVTVNGDLYISTIDTGAGYGGDFTIMGGGPNGGNITVSGGKAQ